MVDFTKQLNSFEDKEIINPEEIYEQLDRASDKGPLRPAQNLPFSTSLFYSIELTSQIQINIFDFLS
jgi:hypothetical protein